MEGPSRVGHSDRHGSRAWSYEIGAGRAEQQRRQVTRTLGLPVSWCAPRSARLHTEQSRNMCLQSLWACFKWRKCRQSVVGHLRAIPCVMSGRGGVEDSRELCNDRRGRFSL